MANQSTRQAKVITPDKLETLRYPLPESWKKAAGLLKHRKIDAMKYQKQVRKEWDERVRRVEGLMEKTLYPE